MKPKVLCLLPESDDNFTASARQRLAKAVEYIPNPYGTSMTDEQKMALCCGVDAVIAGRSGGGLPLGALDAAPQLKVVAVVGGSVKMVHPEALLERGITIINTPAGMWVAVAEYTLALMLMALRDIPHFIDEVRQGRWWRARRPYYTLTGRTVGLVGFGGIAKHLADMLRPFHVRLLVSDPFVAAEVITAHGGEPCDLDTLLRQSDIISLHAGLTPATEHMVGERELRLMKDYAVLVNTARGRLIDEAALARHLEKGRLVAALNVFEKEPLPADSPLRKAPNVILTPHGAGKSLDTFRIQSESIVDDLLRFFAGEQPQYAVTAQMLTRMT